MAGRFGSLRESHEPRLKARDFLVASPTTGYLEWDGSVGIGEQWGMDHNGPDVDNPKWAPNGLGDCGAAATDHYNMAKLQSYSAYGQLGMPQYAGTMGTYFAYGVAQGEVGTPVPSEPDFGVSNATWLAFLYKQGIIDGYGEVEDDETDWFTQTFRGCLLGLSIDGMLASQLFDDYPRKPWNVMAMADGHDTLGLITHSDGSGALITWGGVQPYTLEFRNTNITDRWVIFDNDDPNVNWPALQNALTEIHGTVTPVKEDFLERLEEFAHL